MEVDGRWFVDPETNRIVLFRGVNLGGGTKLPVGIPSHEHDKFWLDYDTGVTFVGRPFPLDEADIHLGRLVDLGFNLLRFIITWEAIEHQGPGIYDQEYLDYVIALLLKCKQHHIKVFIDPHQDTWSRHCGGSGHPGWTLALAGLDPRFFNDTNAAIVQNQYPVPENYPKMIWATNYQKLATSTMFTLFFAGQAYAPLCTVNGLNIQSYLQSHYINAVLELSKRIDAHQLHGAVVIGYDGMNEPGQGYLGIQDITKASQDDVELRKGLAPTPFQGMRLASGIPTTVDSWTFTWRGPVKDKQVLVDPNGREAWLSAEERDRADARFGWQRSEKWQAGCVWATHGVWDKASETVLLPSYFANEPDTGAPASYGRHWLAFLDSYASALWSIASSAILFIQPPILETPPVLPPSFKKLAYAPHWYDGLTLVKKQWCNYNVDYINLKRGKYGTGPLRFVRALRIGEKAIRQCFVDQIETIRDEGIETVGQFPCILGEIGIPYDMVSEKSKLQSFWSWFTSLFFQTRSTGASEDPNSPQNRAMDASINAAEANLVSYSIWSYVPDSDPKWGDRWNGEDLSIWQSPPTNNGSSVSSATKVPSSVTLDKYADSITSSQTLASPSNSNDKLLGSINANVRNILSLHRPHPHKVAGTPTAMRFTAPTLKNPAAFSLVCTPRDDTKGPTEIYIPAIHFPLPSEGSPTRVEVSHGHWRVLSSTTQYWILAWWTQDPFESAQVRLTGTTATPVN